VDDFLSAGECEYLSSLVDDDDGRVQRVASPTFSSSTSSSRTSVSRRTSTTWFCRYDAVPTLLAKARRLLGAETSRMEEPQVVMYRPGEEFSWHYDEVPGSRLGNGGQRVATLLVYLNDVGEGRGGGTAFRDLEGPLEEEEEGGGGEGGEEGDRRRRSPRRRGRLVVTPRRGTALLFFPSRGDGTPDPRTLHRGEAALDGKAIAQVWVHEGGYRAVVPEGNRQSDATEGVEREARRLGFL
jgi:prolyl 4-hydroxylase